MSQTTKTNVELFNNEINEKEIDDYTVQSAVYTWSYKHPYQQILCLLPTMSIDDRLKPSGNKSTCAQNTYTKVFLDESVKSECKRKVTTDPSSRATYTSERFTQTDFPIGSSSNGIFERNRDSCNSVKPSIPLLSAGFAGLHIPWNANEMGSMPLMAFLECGLPCATGSKYYHKGYHLGVCGNGLTGKEGRKQEIGNISDTHQLIDLAEGS